MAATANSGCSAAPPAPLKLMDADNLGLWGDVDAGGAGASAAPPSSSFAWLAAAATSGDVDELRRAYAALGGGAAAAEAAARSLRAAGGPDGLSPLAVAAKRGDLPMVRALAALGAPVDEASNLSGLTPLAAALSAGQEAAARLLLDELSADANARLGATFDAAPRGIALHAAVVAAGERAALAQPDGRRREKAVDAALEELLVSCAADVDVDARDDRGRTALMLAAECGRMGAVRLLVEKARADANAVDRAGCTALMHLLIPINRAWESKLGNHGPPAVDVAEAARLLVSVGGAHVHVGFDDRQMAPLFIAAQRARTKTLRVLLPAPDGKEALRARDPIRGMPALHHARSNCTVDEERGPAEGQASSLGVLLAAGAEGRVAGFRFVKYPMHLPCLRALNCDAKPLMDPSSRANDGTTLLMAAAEGGAVDQALLLLERGADARPSKKEPWGERRRTAADHVLAYLSGERYIQPAHYARLPDLLRALLRKGAPFDVPRYARVVMQYIPSLLSEVDKPLAELARRRTLRQRTLGQEDVVSLAFDWLDVHAAEEGVRVREARVRELEEELGIGGGNEEDEEEEEEEEKGEGEKEEGVDMET